MRQLGVIATEEERIINNRKWYQFWRLKPEYEVIAMEEIGLELYAVYMPQKDKKFPKWHDKTKQFFSEKGIYNIIVTKKAQKLRKIEYSEFKIHNGDELICRMMPKIIAKIAKMKNIDLQQSTLAYFDNDLSQNARELLYDISKKCRYLSLVTKNQEDAHKLANELLDEYGLPVEIYTVNSPKIKCDLAIVAHDEMPDFSDDVIVINLKGYYRDGNITRYIDFRMEEQLIKIMPFIFINKEICNHYGKLAS